MPIEATLSTGGEVQDRVAPATELNAEQATSIAPEGEATTSPAAAEPVQSDAGASGGKAAPLTPTERFDWGVAHPIDFEMARTFLATLGTHHTYQTFDDTKGRKLPGLVKIISGNAGDEVMEKLFDLNADGAGIFVTVNATDGKGRRRGNMVRVRAIFGDFDDPKPGQPGYGVPGCALAQFEAAAAKLPPSIVVESSPGKRHAYWLTDLEVDAGEALQAKMPEAVGCDPAAKDLARVLRVPGFYHRKATPVQVKLLEHHPERTYEAWEITTAFGLDLIEGKAKPKAKADRASQRIAGASAGIDYDPLEYAINERDANLLRSALKTLDATKRDNWIAVAGALCRSGAVGERIFCEWSATAGEAGGYVDDDDCIDKLREMEPNAASKYPAIFTLASATGWVQREATVEPEPLPDIDFDEAAPHGTARMSAEIRDEMNRCISAQASLIEAGYNKHPEGGLWKMVPGVGITRATETAPEVWATANRSDIDGAACLATYYKGDELAAEAAWKEHAHKHGHYDVWSASDMNPVCAQSVARAFAGAGKLAEHPHAIFLDPEVANPRDDEYVLDQLICGGASLVVGSAGVGKTTQIVPLACIAAHLCDPAEPLKPELRRKVIYITEDVGQVRKIIRSMRLAGWFGDISEAEVADHLKLVAAKRMSAAKIAEVASLYSTMTVTNTNPDTGDTYDAKPWIIWDTSNANIALESENDNAEVGEALATLKENFSQKGFPTTLVTHFGKAAKRADISEISSRGASAFEADVNQVMYLVEDDVDPKKRWLEIGSVHTKHRFDAAADGISFSRVSRSVPMLSILGHLIDVGVSHGVPTLVGRGERVQQREAAKAKVVTEKEREARAAVIAFLRDQATPVSKSAVELAGQAAGHSRNIARMVLGRLITDGDVLFDRAYKTTGGKSRNDGVCLREGFGGFDDPAAFTEVL